MSEIVLNPGEALGSGPKTVPEVIKRFCRAPTAHIIFWALVITAGYRISLGNFQWVELLLPLGILAFWPFQEWLIHVFILHFKPKKLGRLTFDLPTAQKHRAHHRAPWKIDLVFMPLHSFIVSFPVLYGLWFLLSPTTEIALSGITFWLIGSLHYEWVHYLTHTRYKPKSRYYRHLWKNHRLHHCKNERYWQGVTLTFADRVLGTAPEPSSVETSKTCRTLGVA